MPHAQVAVVPGSYGGFDRIGELNDRVAAFIAARPPLGDSPARRREPPQRA
jgi:hypothetical protein